MDSVREQKAVLRKEVRQRLAKVSSSLRVAASSDARKLLAAQPAWSKAGSVLFYAALPDEVDLEPLVAETLSQGKQVAFPKFCSETGLYEAREVCDLKADVQVGRFGIREPTSECSLIAINRLDLVLVPGVAFDLCGRRLGRGKGFYDRILAAVCGTSCGVAFDEQIVGTIPVEPHDVFVNCILTPSRWFAVGPRAVLE